MKRLSDVLRGPTEEALSNDLKILQRQSIHVPVGKGVLSRVFNVFGEPIDKKGDVQAEEYRPPFKDHHHFQKLNR
ncbi:MAG: hypothetical protein R2883_08045 [Caldisericia bacterium]